MNLGYALLSLCLFRLLCFIPFNSSFFVLYIGVGFPIGAFLASKFLHDPRTNLKTVVVILPIVALAILLIGLLATRLLEIHLGNLSLIKIVVHIFYLLILDIPFFIIWGAAEYVGYRRALEIPSLKKFFYVITICALLTAFIIGKWSVPHLGLLKTIALVPFCSLLALYFIKPGASLFRLCLFLCLLSLIWAGAGRFEKNYTNLLFSKYAKIVIHGTSQYPTGQFPSSEDIIQLKSFWGKYCHISFFHRQSDNKIICCYDGDPVWPVSPREKSNYDLFGKIAFDEVKENSDICILGTGGGRQVIQAMATNPGKIVAVDIIPEVFEELGGDLSWINGHAFKSPLVQTVSTDGLSYMKNCHQSFDLIVLPATESGGNILKAFFEPGQRLHTLESFKILKTRLKPGGKIVIYKTLDRNERLFNSYAKPLKAAGLNVSGFSIPSKSLEPFILFGSIKPDEHQFSENAISLMKRTPYHAVNFQDVPPAGNIITEKSPWSYGIPGNFLPSFYVNILFWIIFALTIVGLFIVIIYPAFNKSRKTNSPLSSEKIFYPLAGVLVGINALYIENGIIFWFVMNLMNPLAAFYFGTALFLLLWGLSNLGTKIWKALILVALAGIAGMVISGPWDNYVSFSYLLLISAGSGFCFSILILRFKNHLLKLFVFDAIGSFIGGVLGIWIPLIYGLNNYFKFIPWIALATLTVVLIAVRKTAEETDGSEKHLSLP